MSSKVTKKSNKESDEVKCKICHQYISKSKMFLHEGFCSRNNVFCDHCEKVFLKKDYEEHVKLIKKKKTTKEVGSPSNSQKSKETQSETMKPSSYTEENDNISNNMVPLVPKPSLEIVQMPITELYKINAPIFVSETGQIISDKNKNSSLLPFLGINFRSSKDSEKLLEDIIDQGDIFNENNSISENCYDFQGLSSILNKNNIITNNKMSINSSKIIRDSGFSIGSSSIQGNNSINYIYKNNLVNSLHSPLSKTIEINNNDSFSEENKENIPKNSKPKNPKFNTLYIDKSIANHSQKILKKKYNFFTMQQTPGKTPENSTKINNNIKRSVKKNAPLDKASRRTPKRPVLNNLDTSIENNNYQSHKKEPQDSNSKRNSSKINLKFSKFSGGKKINSNYLSETKKSNEQFDSSLKRRKKKNYIFNKFDTHNPMVNSKNTRSNKILDIPKPRRKEKKYDEFVFEVNDETCIDEIKRETLTRQFNPSSLNVVSFNGEKKSYPGFITNPDRNYSQFCKDAKKLSLKKKLFQESIDEKNEKKNFPEDSVRVGLDKEKYKLFKRIYNISLDDKCFGNDEGIKNSKCEITKRNANSLKSGEIYNQLFFNNNKKILLHQKNKNIYKNTIS